MGNLKGIQEAERLMHALPEEIQLYQALLATLQEAVGGNPGTGNVPARGKRNRRGGLSPKSCPSSLFPSSASPQLIGRAETPTGKFCPFLPEGRGREGRCRWLLKGRASPKKHSGRRRRRILSYQKFQLALREKETHSQEERR